MPIFIAITAANHFKVNAFIAVACIAALVSPTWADIAARITAGESITFLGIALSGTTYTSSVLPPLFLVWILSYVERFLNKTIHEVIRPLFVPFFSMVLMVPLTILLIGPITTLGAEGIANGYNYLAENAPAVAGLIIGGFWQVIVIFGVHWGVTPMVLANFEQYGRDSFQAYQTIAVIAQIGAVIGVILKARNKETKKVGVSAGLTGIFGITEPAIYGVTLRFKKPFIYGCISGAIGAVTASFFKPYYFAYAGLPGPLTLVNGIDSDYPSSIIGLLIGTAIALILPIVLIQVFGFGEQAAPVVAPESTATPVAKQEVSATLTNEETLRAPLEGTIVALLDVPDPVFASGAMGQGVAIRPTNNRVTAPFDGTVVMVAPSGHAIGLRSTSGVEVLIHIGLETVTLDGKPFTLHVKEGESVTTGELLVTFDATAIEANGLETITPIIIMNTQSYAQILPTDETVTTANTQILTIIK